MAAFQQLMIAGVVLLLTVAGIDAHIRMLCPAPEVTDADTMLTMVRECGKPTTNPTHPTPITVVKPGPLTLRWEEYVSHPGAPFVVNLVKYIDGDDTPFSSCTLVSHVPHNPENLAARSPASFTDTETCSLAGVDRRADGNPDKDLTGGCGTDSYITVHIPNIECINCGIVISNPLVGNTPCNFEYVPGSATGENPDLPNKCSENGPIYSSCSRIVIQTTPGTTGAEGADDPLTDQICHPHCAADDDTCHPVGWPFNTGTGFPPHVFATHNAHYTDGWLQGEQFDSEARHLVSPDDSLPDAPGTVKDATWARNSNCEFEPLHLGGVVSPSNKPNQTENDGDALGVVAATVVSRTQMHVSVSLKGLSSPITGAHLHGPGCEIADAPVVVDVSDELTPATHTSADEKFSVKFIANTETLEKHFLRFHIEKADAHDPAAIPATLRAVIIGTAAVGETGIGGDKTIELPMSSRSQVPPLPQTLSSGFITVEITGNTLTWRVVLLSIEDVTGVHFHGPASRTENGPVWKDLGITTDGEHQGTIQFANEAERDEYTEYFHQGKMYVNAHTEANPNGELRSQIDFTYVDLGSFASRASYAGQIFVEPLMMKSIFVGLSKVYIFDAALTTLGSTLVSVQDVALVDSFVHRGSLTGGQEVPPVTTTLASGQFEIEIVGPSSVRYYIEAHGMVPTVAHLHGPAKPDANGGVIVEIPNAPGIVTVGGIVGVLEGLTPAQMDAVKYGSVYINVHSEAHPNGELRGSYFVHPVASSRTLNPHFNGAITVDEQTMAMITRGDTYLNIHTANFPNGEARAQLRLGMTSHLHGSATPTSTNVGGATMVMSLPSSAGQVEYHLVASQVMHDITKVSLHGPAGKGETAPPTTTLLDGSDNVAVSTDNLIRTAITLDPLQVRRADNQLALSPSDSYAYGTASFVRTDAQTMRYRVQVFQMSPVTAVIVVQDSNVQVGTRVLCTLVSFDESGLSSGSCVMTPEDIGLMQEGKTYVQVTSGLQPLGEVRGQIRFGSQATGVLGFTAEQIRFLYEGQLYATVTTTGSPDGDVRGHITRPPAQFCPPRPSILENSCFFSRLTTTQAIPEFRCTKFPKSEGSAGIVISSGGTLTINMEIRHLEGEFREVVLGKGGFGADGTAIQSDNLKFQVVQSATGARIVDATFLAFTKDAAVVEALRDGQLYVAVLTTVVVNGTDTIVQELRGQLPRLHRDPNANGAEIFVPAQGQSFTPETVPDPITITATAGDKLKFLLPDNTRLKKTPTRLCSSAVGAAIPGASGPKEFTYLITEEDVAAGDLIITTIDSTKCQGGLVVTVTFEANAGDVAPVPHHSQEIPNIIATNKAKRDFVGSVAFSKNGTDTDAAVSICRCAASDNAKNQTRAVDVCNDHKELMRTKDVVKFSLGRSQEDAKFSGYSEVVLKDLQHQLGRALQVDSGNSTEIEFSPQNVVSEEVDSSASGKGTITWLSATSIGYKFELQGIEVAAAHFHGPALPTTEAPTGVLHVVNFQSSVAEGVWDGISEEDMRSVLYGLVYVNIHSAAFPNGELRANIIFDEDPVVNFASTKISAGNNFNAELFVQQVTPKGGLGPDAGSALGTGQFSLLPNNHIMYEVGFHGYSAAEITGVRIHGPAARGADSTEVSYELAAGVEDELVYKTNGTWAAPAVALQALTKGLLYVEVYTVNHPRGALRGQIEANVEVIASETKVALLPANEAPPVESPAIGVMSVKLINDTIEDVMVLEYNLEISGIASGEVSAHLHGPATLGANGGVLHVLTVADEGEGRYASNGKIVLSKEDYDLMLQNLMYINVHSATHPNGELRGQIELERTAAQLYPTFACEAKECNLDLLRDTVFTLNGKEYRVQSGSVSQVDAPGLDTTSNLVGAVVGGIIVGFLAIVALIVWDNRSTKTTRYQTETTIEKETHQPSVMANPVYTSTKAVNQKPTIEMTNTAAYRNEYEQPDAFDEPQELEVYEDFEIEKPARPIRPVAAPRAPIIWESAIDPESGDTYYINTQTNETAWEIPDSSEA